MSLHNYFKGIGELYTKEIELAAIWMQNPVYTAAGRTPRLTEGDLIKVDNGKIVDCLDKKPTHKIIGCYGTVTSSSLSFILVDLKTNQPETFRVK